MPKSDTEDDALGLRNVDYYCRFPLDLIDQNGLLAQDDRIVLSLRYALEQLPVTSRQGVTVSYMRQVTFGLL